MTIKEIHIYPIKSLGGISLPHAHVEERGLQYDRRWMLVDKEGTFLTQRENPQLAKFSCSIQENELEVNYGKEKIRFSMDQSIESIERVKVWSSKLKAPEVDPVVSEWFSEHLQTPVKLVAMTPISKRAKRLFVPPYSTSLSFADGYPILLLGTASMDTLNEQCPEIIPANRFRANIFLNTDAPHIEDEKISFSLGQARLKVIKPCARCTVITIDQSNGEKGKEPLKTLAKYRLRRNKIWFGANAICLQEGLVSIGDAIIHDDIA